MNTDNQPDKRKRKQEEKRINTLNTLIDIILKTGKEPTIDEIASQSTISRRSLFNYYRNKDKLIKELNEVLIERISKMVDPESLENIESFEKLIDQLISIRVKIYEYISPIRRIVEAKKISSAFLQENAKKNFKADYKRLSNRFLPFLQGKQNQENIIIMLISTISWDNWNFLRNQLNLDIEEGKAILKSQMLAIFNTSC